MVAARITGAPRRAFAPEQNVCGDTGRAARASRCGSSHGDERLPASRHRHRPERDPKGGPLAATAPRSLRCAAEWRAWTASAASSPTNFASQEKTFGVQTYDEHS